MPQLPTVRSATPASAPASAPAATSGRGPEPVSRMLERCMGCKWTLHILAQIRQGIVRPGQLERSAPGLTTKVLNERLKKLVGFGVIDRVSYPEVPPRVEYLLTPFGLRFVAILDEIDRLQHDRAAEGL